jgi:hypothetical protein
MTSSKGKRSAFDAETHVVKITTDIHRLVKRAARTQCQLHVAIYNCRMYILSYQGKELVSGSVDDVSDYISKEFKI